MEDKPPNVAAKAVYSRCRPKKRSALVLYTLAVNFHGNATVVEARTPVELFGFTPPKMTLPTFGTTAVARVLSHDHVHDGNENGHRHKKLSPITANYRDEIFIGFWISVNCTATLLSPHKWGDK